MKNIAIILAGGIGSRMGGPMPKQFLSLNDKPVIVQNIDKWFVYASDGTCFGQDLIARSDYEEKLL